MAENITALRAWPWLAQEGVFPVGLVVAALFAVDFGSADGLTY